MNSRSRLLCLTAFSLTLSLSVGSSCRTIVESGAAQAEARGTFPESGTSAASGKTDDTIWLENEFVRVGLKRSSGGAISWIGPVGSTRSLINSFDRGRLVQQSWYGREDGSVWDKRPWRWNPVQGGDWKGKSARILQEQHEKTTAFIKTQPVHWASGEELTDCVMEQTVKLESHLIHVHYRFACSGQTPNPPHHQELPAFFVDASLKTLVLYSNQHPWTGDTPARSEPGWPNEYKKMTENWAAYVGEDDAGIGCFVPVAEELTCYRYNGGKDPADSCSYFAPIRTIAITPEFEWEYDVWITMGSVAEIRERFQELMKSRQDGRSTTPPVNCSSKNQQPTPRF